MFTGQFWKRTVERAVKTAAQAAVLAMVAGTEAVNAFSVSWEDVLGFAAGGFALSVLTSLASAPFADEGSPSLVSTDEPSGSSSSSIE